MRIAGNALSHADGIIGETHDNQRRVYAISIFRVSNRMNSLLRRRRAASAVVCGALAVALALLLASTNAVFAVETNVTRAADDGCSAAVCDDVCRCRELDQWWILSSRGLPCRNYDQNAARVAASRRDGCGDWRRSTFAEFMAANDPSLVTCVFVHGNRVDGCDDYRLAEMVHRGLTQCLPDRPIRFVYWSWPSDKIPRHPLEDVRAKAARSDADSHYLARALAASNRGTSISLVGFSYGARIITGALHLIGGGAVDGQSLSSDAIHPHGPYRAVLLAAAVDNDALLPGRVNDRALGQVERMLVVTNECDGVLQRYHYIYCRKSCALALGSTGPAGVAMLGDDGRKLSSFDACCMIGKTHDMPPYVQCAAVVSRETPFLFPADGE